MHYKLILFFIFLLNFVSCTANKEKSILIDNDFRTSLKFEQLRDRDLLPQWFFSPSSYNQIGSVGISRTVSIGGDGAYYAKKYALKGLFDYFEISVDENNKNYIKLLKGKEKTANIKGRVFSVPDILYSHDYVIARAVSAGASCGVGSDISKGFFPYECIPHWICSPAAGDGGCGGVIGVSYRAVSPQRQYELAIKNGLLLLKYSYGVDIKGSEDIRRLRSGTGVLRLRKNNFSLKLLGDKDKIKLHVKGIRFSGERMYLWLVSPDLPSFGINNSWIYGNISSGAVGSSGKTAANLLSSQIDRAVQNALVNMAKNKELGIEVVEFLRKTSEASLFDQIIKSSVNTKIFPGLRGFYLDREDRVTVWMVPN